MPDTLKIDKLIARAVSVVENSPDVSLEMLERALIQAREDSYTSAEAVILFQLGRVHIVLGNYKDSIIYLKSALLLFEILEEMESIINTLCLIGMNQNYIGNYAEAIKNYEESLALAEKLQNDSITSKILNNVGEMYYSMDEFDSAKKYFLKSIPLKEKLNDKKGLAATYTNLGMIYTVLKDIDSAADYITKAIEIKKNFTETFKDEASLAFAKSSLGSIKRLEKKYSEALEIYEEVLDIYLRQNNLLMLCETYTMIAATFLDINDTVNAQKSLNAGEQFVKRINATRITDEFKKLSLQIIKMNDSEG